MYGLIYKYATNACSLVLTLRLLIKKVIFKGISYSFNWQSEIILVLPTCFPMLLKFVRNSVSFHL